MGQKNRTRELWDKQVSNPNTSLMVISFVNESWWRMWLKGDLLVFLRFQEEFCHNFHMHKSKDGGPIIQKRKMQAEDKQNLSLRVHKNHGSEKVMPFVTYSIQSMNWATRRVHSRTPSRTRGNNSCWAFRNCFWISQTLCFWYNLSWDCKSF